MKRVARFGLVLTPAEKCALARLSEAEGGLSQAATVRRLIRREAGRHGLWPVQQGQESKIEQVGNQPEGKGREG